MDDRMLAYPALADFLADPKRPAGTLRYHELQGFLFAVTAAPDLVMPSEWLPEVFGGQAPDFDDADQENAILEELRTLYNSINMSAGSGQAKLPDDCRFADDPMANLADDAPISLWCRGFTNGHQWMEESWDAFVPDSAGNDFGLQVMTLSFFATPALAAAFAKEIGRSDMPEVAALFRKVFPDAVQDYAWLGRAISEVLETRNAAPAPRAKPAAGRNVQCPCGSGRTFKKCCGAG
jgi:uncharacterized protein